MATTTTVDTPPPIFTADNGADNHGVDPPPLIFTADNGSDTAVGVDIIATGASAQQPPQAPEDTSPVANNSSGMPSQSRELQSRILPVTPLPHFVVSITELRNLADSIATFHQCYADLCNHLDSVKAAIVTKLEQEKEDMTTVPLSSSPCEESAPVSEEKELPKQERPQHEKSELEILCRMMCSRSLRKYMITNLSHSDLAKLREEVPKALKLAANPAKLVLDCFGKFFLQGSKAYAKDSPMIPAREASVFMLECFLLMMGINDSNGVGNEVVKIDREVKEEAENSAVAWRKRLLTEGGLHKTCEIEARGLFLLVSCFGIPASFKKEDIRDLLMASNKMEILDLLRRSSLLMNKLSASLDEMIKNKMEVDAVDIVYTFELQEKFNPQAILASFLRESKESWKKAKQLAQGSPVAMNEANRKQLAALKSVVRCLEYHKLDPAKLLPGWQISAKMHSLEKEVSRVDRRTAEKTTEKRRIDENEASKRSKPQESKRPRFTSHSSQQQVATNHVDNRRNLLDTGIPGRAVNYPVVYGGPGAGMIPESMLPTSGAGISASHGGHLPTGSHGAATARYAGQPSSVGQLGLTTLYRPSSSLEGFPGMPNVSSVTGAGQGSGSGSDLYQFADAVVERDSSYPTGGVPRSAVSTVAGALPAYHSSYLY